MYVVVCGDLCSGRAGRGGRRYSAVRHCDGKREESGTKGPTRILAPRRIRRLCSIYAILFF